MSSTNMEVENVDHSFKTSGDNPPSETLYVRNLNEKLKKPKLKEQLHLLFSKFGDILDIVTLRRKGLRGQAWVIFSNVSSATSAKVDLQGKEFFDKPLDIHFAKEKSDLINKRENPSFEPNRQKRTREEDTTTNGAGNKRAAKDTPVTNNADILNQVPTKMLLAKNLPSDCTADALKELFKQYQGFKEVRMVPSHNLAFIDFDNELNARPALMALSNFKLSDSAMLNLSFAKE